MKSAIKLLYAVLLAFGLQSGTMHSKGGGGHSGGGHGGSHGHSGGGHHGGHGGYGHGGHGYGHGGRGWGGRGWGYGAGWLGAGLVTGFVLGAIPGRYYADQGGYYGYNPVAASYGYWEDSGDIDTSVTDANAQSVANTNQEMVDVE